MSEFRLFPDGRAVAIELQTEILRLLHRFGWLRTKDLASVIGCALPKSAPKAGPNLQPPSPSKAEIRRIQRHLASLKNRRMVLVAQAPNGSWIYALSEGGGRALQNVGVPASTGRDLLRNYHAAFFLHRNIANEVAISAMTQGFRVSTEREIAQGKWIGGTAGIRGKRPDVVIRSGSDVWLVEVERSHRNRRDYEHMKQFLLEVWQGCRIGEAADIGDGHQLRQVVFLCTPGFAQRLTKDLLGTAWSTEQLAARIRFETSLYDFKDIAFY